MRVRRYTISRMRAAPSSYAPCQLLVEIETKTMNDARTKHDRRTELLTAARTIFAEKGFETTTVAEIVARAGVAQGTFYLYFPSKYALVNELNQEMNERIMIAVEETVKSGQSVAEIVSQGVAVVFRELESYRDVLNVIRTRASSDQTLLKWEKQFGVYHQIIADLIRQRQSFGEVDPEVQPEIAAKLIVGLIHHGADDCYLYSSESHTDEYQAEMRRFIFRALGIK